MFTLIFIDKSIKCKVGCHPTGGYCNQPGQCRCNSGWSGTNCSVPDCPNKCQNGACNVPNNCVCNDGWNGVNCTQPVCHQKCNPTGGQCTAPDTCTCNAEWTGGLCDVPVSTQIGMALISLIMTKSNSSKLSCYHLMWYTLFCSVTHHIYLYCFTNIP